MARTILDDSRWARVFKELSSDADFEHAMVNGMIVRVRQHAAGALKKGPSGHRTLAGRTDDQNRRADRRAGQLGAIRAAAGASARAAGRRGAAGPAGVRGAIADKAYDADALCAELPDHGAQAVIPPKANRADEIECDPEMYKWRHSVENFFRNIKCFRRIATHCEKTDSSCRGMIHAVSSCLALA